MMTYITSFILRLVLSLWFIGTLASCAPDVAVQSLDKPAANPVAVSPETKTHSAEHQPTQHHDAALPQPGYWIWTKGKSPDSMQTYDVTVINSVVTVRSQKRGIHLWLDANGFEIVVEPHKIQRCIWNEDGEVCASGDTNTVVSLSLKSPAGSTSLHPAPMNLEKMTEVDHSLNIVATIGPYVAYEESLNANGLGATHGSWWVKQHWADLRTGAPVDLLARYPATPRVQNTLRERLCKAFVACQMENSNGDLGDAEAIKRFDAECTPKIVGLEPLWGVGGFFRRYIATVDTSYVCAEGDNANAITQRFGAVPFDGELAAAAKIPLEIENWVKSLPNGTTLGGITTVLHQ